MTYIAFYKPYGVLTAFTGEPGQVTLKTYLDVPGVYPVGRLDMDSEGLLLLTDDGPLAHRLTDPRFNHPKTYLVQVEGQPTPADLNTLERGVLVKGVQTRRTQVMVVPDPALPEREKPVTPHGPTTWLRLVLREGKKRQIRHMTAAVGLPTLRLVRLAVGPIALGDLQPGEWRYLSAGEITALQGLGRAPATRVAVVKKEPAGEGQESRMPAAKRPAAQRSTANPAGAPPAPGLGPAEQKPMREKPANRQTTGRAPGAKNPTDLTPRGRRKGPPRPGNRR